MAKHAKYYYSADALYVIYDMASGNLIINMSLFTIGGCLL